MRAKTLTIVSSAVLVLGASQTEAQTATPATSRDSALRVATAPATSQVPASTVKESPRRDSTPAPAALPAIAVGDRGITFSSPDGGTKLVLRTRLQNLAEVTTVSTSNFAAQEMSMAPRRVRLRLDGSVMDPRLTIKLQLSFSRRDQDFDETQAANVVRDAAAYWRFNPTFQIGFGQTKLPGNRQRVVSSGDLQFAERSLVNNRFTIDRDQGFFARVDRRIGRAAWNLQYAMSLGEGRNQPRQGAGVANTARVELLPLGLFTAGNDYVEGDLQREAAPRLSIGLTYSGNSRTTRTGGQLGAALWSPRSTHTLLADAVFKYRGAAVYVERAQRTSDDPITTKTGSANRYIFVGRGTLVQASYAIGRWEPAVRVASVTPYAAIAGEAGAFQQRQTSAGLTRYINRHRIKLQGEVMHNEQRLFGAAATRNFTFRLNSEVGI